MSRKILLSDGDSLLFFVLMVGGGIRLIEIQKGKTMNPEHSCQGSNSEVTEWATIVNWGDYSLATESEVSFEEVTYVNWNLLEIHMDRAVMGRAVK